MKPQLRTAAIDARLDEVARLKVSVPTYEELRRETGLSIGYLRKLVMARMDDIRNKCSVSCETKGPQ
jgi:hypothetical protein